MEIIDQGYRNPISISQKQRADIAKLKPELGAQRASEARDSFINLLGGSSRESGTEEHLFLGSVVIGLEPATAGEQDTRIDGRQEDLFFDLSVALAGSNARVLAPVNLNPVLQNVSI